MRQPADPVIYCLRLLKTRLRSSHELDVALERRGIADEERVTALQTLTELQLVDDVRFATAWVHTRDKLSPRGESVLRLELLQKGIAKEIIEEALEQRRQPSDEQPTELELALELLRRKERQFAHLVPLVKQRRQIALLQRRGFSYALIKRILVV